MRQLRRICCPTRLRIQDAADIFVFNFAVGIDVADPGALRRNGRKFFLTDVSLNSLDLNRDIPVFFFADGLDILRNAVVLGAAFFPDRKAFKLRLANLVIGPRGRNKDAREDDGDRIN